MNQHLEPWILPYVRILIFLFVIHLGVRAWTQFQANKTQSALALAAISLSFVIVLVLRMVST
jgi:cytoskeletal protein RodZ